MLPITCRLLTSVLVCCLVVSSALPQPRDLSFASGSRLTSVAHVAACVTALVVQRHCSGLIGSLLAFEFETLSATCIAVTIGYSHCKIR